MTSFASLRSGKAVYRVLAAIGDGPDADITPDAIPVTGSGVLTPQAQRIVDHGPASTATVLPRPVPVIFVDGNMTYRNESGVWLLASEAGVWRWHASFDYQVGGATVHDEFYFDLPPGDPDNPGYTGTDLSTARVLVNPSTGIPTMTGPPGRSVSDVQLLPDGLRFVMSTGDDIELSVPSLGNLSNAASDAATAAATATSAASSASTSATTAQAARTAAEAAKAAAESASATATTAAATAGTKATEATDAAATASNRASIATNAASGASSSATNASMSATAAAASATAAAASATTAATEADDAVTASSAASGSATAAGVSEANAAASAADAQEWAEQALAVVVDGIPNASDSVKGGLRLTGDLSGTWDNPTVPALAQKADLVGGVIPTSQIPAIALVKPSVVASQAAMLALVAQTGDVAVRSDGAGTFMLAAEPASVLANWVQLAAQDGGVTSINGQNGVVVLGPGDVGAAPASHTHTSSALTDVTPVGTALLQAPTAANARTAIGAGTSSLALGTTAGTARAGDWKPTAADITDATAAGRQLLKASSLDNARSLIAAFPAAGIQVVTSLPATGVEGVLYFVREN